MHKVRLLMLSALWAGAANAVYAAPENGPAAQSGHASTYQGTGQPQWEITQPPTTRSSGGLGINAADCSTALGHEAAERIDPPGPVSQSGTASAMVEDSGTLGSTGSTRASSTSGATGTTGEIGNYGADPSGSVTTAGSTGARIDPLSQCDAGPATSSGASENRDRQGTMQGGQSAPVQRQQYNGPSTSGQPAQGPMQQDQ